MRALKLWNRYAREHRREWLAGCGIAAAFFAVAALYQMWESVYRMTYALALVFFCFCVWTAFDFAHYVKKQAALLRAMQNVQESAPYLPPAENLAEERYQSMLAQAEADGRALQSAFDSRGRDMSDYYSLWAHQIKTPIAALHLLLHNVGAQQRQAMEEQLFKTEQYVEMVLQYVRLDDMSSDLLVKEYDVERLVKNAVKKCAVLFIGSGLSLTVEPIQQRTVTDEKWFSFVVEQLLSNAAKYTKEGGVRIRGVGADCIVIEDDGIGIPQSDLPRIFERGFTGYNGRIYQKSTGIGLYLCRQTAQKLGISITVTSQVNVGTKVLLTFQSDKNVS